MKRVNNIYEKVIEIKNLEKAEGNARKGKVNTYGVKLFDRNREGNIKHLHNMLRDKTYHTSPYEVFTIYEPKERLIYRLPYFPDRITHHAIMNILEPIWINIFTRDTYSCIPGRGIHGVVRKLKNDLKDTTGTQYCLKIDIKKFYPSIDHGILKSIIRKKIKDSDLLWLLDEIIDSAPGVPIGNYLSQYFANLYLAYFDHWVKERQNVKYYYRYADDMVFLSSSKEELHQLLSNVSTYLSNNLNLLLKPNYQIFPVDSRGIDFVGYVFFHSHILMRKSIKQRFIKSAKKIKTHDVRHDLSSYYGWAMHCNSRNLIKKISYEKV